MFTELRQGTVEKSGKKCYDSTVTELPVQPIVIEKDKPALSQIPAIGEE